MNMKRVWYSFRLCTILSAPKRAAYLKKKNVFHSMGENVSIMARKIPLYSNLISFHNNIRVGSGVSFLTHDTVHGILKNMGDHDSRGNELQENVGCIEIMDNVYIGANVMIDNNVRIGPNAIISAGSVVTKDVPPNSVVAGNPAKIIGRFDVIEHFRERKEPYPDGMVPQAGEYVSKDLEDYLWKEFEDKRNWKQSKS